MATCPLPSFIRQYATSPLAFFSYSCIRRRVTASILTLGRFRLGGLILNGYSSVHRAVPMPAVTERAVRNWSHYSSHTTARSQATTTGSFQAFGRNVFTVSSTKSWVSTSTTMGGLAANSLHAESVEKGLPYWEK